MKNCYIPNHNVQKEFCHQLILHNKTSLSPNQRLSPNLLLAYLSMFLTIQFLFVNHIRFTKKNKSHGLENNYNIVINNYKNLINNLNWTSKPIIMKHLEWLFNRNVVWLSKYNRSFQIFKLNSETLKVNSYMN